MINIENYKQNKINLEEMFNNLKLEYFLKDGNSDLSLINYIQEEKPEIIKNNIEKILKFFSNFSNNDIELLSKDFGYLSSDEDNWLEEIIRIVHYTIKYPDLFDIYEWKDDFNGYKPFKLKDPFYPFDELINLKKLKDNLKIKEKVFLDVLRTIIYDYATYQIGSYNSDLREEFMDFYENEIMKYLISEFKEKKGYKSSKDEQLKIYKYNLKKYENRKSILDFYKNSFKEIPSNLKEEFLNMYEENNKNLENIPEKYRKLEVINEELNKLSME